MFKQRVDTLVAWPPSGDDYHWLKAKSDVTYCGVLIDLTATHQRIGLRMTDRTCGNCYRLMREGDHPASQPETPSERTTPCPR